jgi:hypothetical protein
MTAIRENPTRQSGLVRRNRELFQAQQVQPQFDHCERCRGADCCYAAGGAPRLLTFDCHYGPMVNEE